MNQYFDRTPPCLLLLLGFLFFLPLIGGEAMADGVWAFDNNIDSLTPYQDGVMLLEGGQLWFWNPDQPEPQKIGDAIFFGIQALFTDDDGQLLALSGGSEGTRLLCCLINGQKLSVTEVCRLTLPDAENHFVYNAFYQQSMVFVLLLNRHTGQETLYAYDTASQQEWIWDNFPTQRIAPYRDKLILGSQTDARMTESLVTMDITTKQTNTISALPGFAEILAYSKQTNDVAYLRRPSVYAGPVGGTMTEQGYLPVTSHYTDKGALTSNGYFAMADDNRLLWTKLDPEFSKNTGTFLTIADAGMEMDATRLFRLDHPEIPVITRNVYLKPEDVAQAIRGNDTETDIFVTRTAYPGYGNLLSKGFGADLSSDSDLMALVQNMPEALQKGLMYDGKLMAFPIDIGFGNMAFSYSPEALAAIGVTEDVLPDNLSDLLSLLIKWYESGKMDEVRLFDHPEPDYLLTIFLLRYYTEYYETTQEEPLHYKSELFYELMEKMDRLIQLMKEYPQTSELLPVLLMTDGPGSQFMEHDNETRWVFFPLIPNKGMPLRFTISMKVCIVNPRSQKLTQSMLYLRSLEKNMDALNRLFLWPDTTVPVEDPSYTQVHQEISEIISHIERDILEAPVENQKELTTLLEENKRDLASAEQYRWTLSQETIDAYKKYAPYVYLSSNLAITMIDMPEMTSILKRYLAGHMDWKQLVIILEDRLKKIKGE